LFGYLLHPLFTAHPPPILINPALLPVETGYSNE
jgi:hypothetical protein